MRKTLICTFTAAAVVAYLVLAPVPIQLHSWAPPQLVDEAPGNTELERIQKLDEGLGIGPEGVSLDARGRLYAGYEDGRVMRFAPDGSASELIANTGGRPWGTYAYPDGERVLVADAKKGLLLLHEGRVETLATQADGVPFKQTDDVVLAANGSVYFSDASSRYGVDQVIDSVLAHGNDGRLMRYDPNTAKVEVLMKGLHVANGVTLGPDDEYLLVAETLRYRVWRYWLKGERAGTAEVLIENLPGFPDNISYNGRDGFWLALFAPRDPGLDAVLPYPLIRKLLYRLPESLRPRATGFARVLKIDEQGKILMDLQDPGEHAYQPITSVREADGWLYFGSIAYPALGRMQVPRP